MSVRKVSFHPVMFCFMIFIPMVLLAPFRCRVGQSLDTLSLPHKSTLEPQRAAKCHPHIYMEVIMELPPRASFENEPIPTPLLQSFVHCCCVSVAPILSSKWDRNNPQMQLPPTQQLPNLTFPTTRTISRTGGSIGHDAMMGVFSRAMKRRQAFCAAATILLTRARLAFGGCVSSCSSRRHRSCPPCA